MFRFWSAAPRLLVPDNLKSGIHQVSFYDPEVNRSYVMMAAHYNVGILPPSTSFPSASLTEPLLVPPGRDAPRTRRPSRRACGSHSRMSSAGCATSCSFSWPSASRGGAQRTMPRSPARWSG